jgi:hypothetical protein
MVLPRHSFRSGVEACADIDPHCYDRDPGGGRYARFFLAPIAFALFIAALVWPLQSALQRHMPQLVALAIVTLTIVVVFLLFGSLIAWSFGRVGRGVINDAARFQVLYDQLTNWLESHGIVLARLWRNTSMRAGSSGWCRAPHAAQHNPELLDHRADLPCSRIA